MDGLFVFWEWGVDVDLQNFTFPSAVLVVLSVCLSITQILVYFSSVQITFSINLFLALDTCYVPQISWKGK